MIQIGIDEIVSWEKRYRSTFMNSLSGFKNCVLVGTQNKNHETNLAIFNTLIHLGADPAMLGLLFRPLSEERHTYENIKECGIFTVNHVSVNIFKQAHQSSAKYARGVSEFTKCGLQEEFIENFSAPFVNESKIKLGLEYAEEHVIEANGTIFIVGKIKHVLLEEQLIENDGYINAELAESICVNGLDAYHQTRLLERLPYARPRNVNGY